MKVYLVQHGEAMSKEEDPARPLTPRGRKDVESTAKFLNKMDVKVAAIFHSTKLRARQTAEILASYLEVEAKEAKELEPLAEPRIWVERIEKMEEDIIIVGHLPHLSRVASLLLCGEEKEILSFHQGGVICLERKNGWKVLFSVPPWVLE